MSASATHEQPTSERRRTTWDLILGVLLVIGGFVVLGDVVLATAVSVLLVGWTALLSGVVLLVGAFLQGRSGSLFSTALGGVLLIVLGLFLLRNVVVGAVALTLMSGAMFLAAGMTRIVVAAQQRPQGWWVLVLSGLVSVGLGVWVLLNIVAASLTLLGVMMGIQVLLEGITLMTVGRVRAPRAVPEPVPPPGAPA